MNSESEIITYDDNAQPLATTPQLPRQGFEPPEPDLTPEQIKALELIMEGAKPAEILEGAKIGRTTLWRWQNSDPNFMAALNRWRSDTIMQARNRVHAMTEKATDAIKGALTETNARLGAMVLEKLDCLKPGPIVPVDPYAIFGIGQADESVRGPLIKKMIEVSTGMTDDQKLRAPQLLALGVAIENHFANRNSSPDLLEIAGPLPDLVTEAPVAPPASANIPVAPTDSNVLEPYPRQKSVGATAPLRVHVRAVRSSDDSPIVRSRRR